MDNLTIENEDIDELTSLILSDYGDKRVIDQMDVFELPNRKKIEKITDELFEIIYPGYYTERSERSLKIYNLRHTLGALVEDIVYNLRKQIAVALCLRPDVSGISQKDKECGCLKRTAESDGKCTQKAKEITSEFVRTIPGIRQKLEMDIDAFYEGDPAAENKSEIICSYPGLRAITVYRLAHELHKLGVPIIPRTMTEYAHARTGIDIHPGAQIGDYFFIDHGTGVVIGETTLIGNHVKIYQGVTLGGLSTQGGQSLKGVKRHPTIEDNVIIYSGASVLGGETVIGHDSVIGGNAFVTKSVEPNSKVNVKNK